MRNPSLASALQEYCSQALRVLRESYPTDASIPRVTGPRARIEGDGVSYRDETELDVTQLLNAAETDDYRRIPARAAVDAAMRADDQVARHLDTMVGTPGWSYRVTVPACLRMLLSQLIGTRESLDFDEASFAAIYGAMEDYFYSDVARLRAVVSLPGFQMACDCIDLDHRLRIVRLDLREREEALTADERFPLLGRMVRDFSFGHDPFGLELLLERPKIFGSAPTSDSPPPHPSDVAAEYFEEAVLALRLFKSGAVRYSVIRLKLFGWAPRGGLMTQGAARASTVGAYTLSGEETVQFGRFWSEYRRARERNRSRIALALRRLDFGYERLRPEDRLVDYMIGLEALLTKSGERGSLAYRLALRGSRLLERDSSARATLYSALRRAYQLRSDIVHGGTPPGEAVAIDGTRMLFGEFVDRIADYLRDTIKELMRRTECADETHTIEMLDADIVAGR